MNYAKLFAQHRTSPDFVVEVCMFLRRMKGLAHVNVQEIKLRHNPTYEMYEHTIPLEFGGLLFDCAVVNDCYRFYLV